MDSNNRKLICLLIAVISLFFMTGFTWPSMDTEVGAGVIKVSGADRLLERRFSFDDQ